VRITFIDYAEDSLSDRKISKDLIKDAILNPDEIVEGKKARKIAHKLIGDKLLRVIYEIDTKSYIVITAYFTKPKRYFNK